jgi:L-Ala-D/L-Glu epimerase
VKLTLKQHKLQLASTWKIARGSETQSVTASVAYLEDENQLVGIGEAAPISRYNESITTVEEFISKLDLGTLDFNDLGQSLDYLNSLEPGNMAAKCALNIALHDGAAKLAQQPIYDFLGLGFREQHHITSFSIGIGPLQSIREKTLAANEFSILKLKLGVPEDAEIFQALRQAAPKKLVRIDANEGWKTKEQALESILWLAEQGRVEFVEQPMPALATRDDWRWLKERSPLPIFADESFHTADDAEWCADCFHGVNVKLVKTGGISGAVEALRTARKHGLRTMLGCMLETSVLITAAAHLAELADYLDLDGNLLVTNDPYAGVQTKAGILSFADAPDTGGLRVLPRTPAPEQWKSEPHLA